MLRTNRIFLLCPAVCALVAATGCAGGEDGGSGNEQSASVSDGGASTNAAIDTSASDDGEKTSVDDHTTDGPARDTQSGNPAHSPTGNPDGDEPDGDTTTNDTGEAGDDDAGAPEPNGADGDPNPRHESTGTPDGDAGSGSTDESPPREPDPTLNAGEYSVAAFDYAAEKPVGYNPLGKTRFDLLRLEETALLANGGSSTLIDDGQHDHATLPIAASLLPSNAEAVWSGAGRLDADGFAELVVVSRDANDIDVVIGDDDGQSALTNAASFSIANGGATAGGIKVQVADFDGDGLDEIAIAAVGENGFLDVFDDKDHNFQSLKHTTLTQNQADVDLAAGNFDADDAAELAVLVIGKGTDNLALRVLDDVARDLATLSDWTAGELLPPPEAGDDKSVWLSGGIVRSGNIDGDATDELYVLLSQKDAGEEGSGGQQIRGRVIDDVTGSRTIIATPQVGDGVYPNATLDRPFDAAFADMDGDGVDELYLLHLQSDEPDFAWDLTQWNPDANTGKWTTKANYTKLDGGYNATSLARLAVVDGDGLSGEGLVIAIKQSGSPSPIKTWRVAAAPVVTEQDTRTSFALQIGAPDVSSESYPSAAVPLVAGGDFDNDSLQVAFTGDSWLSLSSPRPIVVMAAPPIKAGISQNTNTTSTSFGQETTQGSTQSYEVSTSYATTLSFESSTITSLFGAFGGIASASISESMESAFSSTDTLTTLESVGTKFTGAYPDDCIVFQGVLYTSYAYEITQASDPTVLGQRITIDVPVQIKTYKWTLDFYNEMLQDGDVAIGTETLGHVTGDPTSYPTAQVRDALLAAGPGWKSKQTAVGQGSGSVSVNIDLSKETTSTSTNTITNEESWGVAIAGAGYDSSSALGNTSAYSVSIGTSTTYEGVVGDILDHDDYQRYAYDFGLFVYSFQHPQGPRFQVVNYWTGNFGPGL
ncbi:MAG TPA: hypothetical protein VHM70_24600 [Polyangiaceae bacterium]|nr:hypothetical protein [Polyangiaceae bacterium]